MIGTFVLIISAATIGISAIINALIGVNLSIGQAGNPTQLQMTKSLNNCKLQNP